MSMQYRVERTLLVPTDALRSPLFPCSCFWCLPLTVMWEISLENFFWLLELFQFVWRSRSAWEFVSRRVALVMDWGTGAEISFPSSMGQAQQG